MSSVFTSESNPRDARLIARRSNGSALHTLDHQFSKSRAQKVPAQTPMLTGRPDPGQGGLIVEDTARPPCPTPPARWPNPDARGTFTFPMEPLPDRRAVPDRRTPQDRPPRVVRVPVEQPSGPHRRPGGD